MRFLRDLYVSAAGVYRLAANLTLELDTLIVSKSGGAQVAVKETGSGNAEVKFYDTTDGGWTLFSQDGNAHLASVNSGGSFVADALTVTAAGLATIAQLNTTDSTFKILDNSDSTKAAQFQASGIATGTTRTFTLPDASGTVALNERPTFALGPWHLPDVPAGATTEMLLGFFNTTTAVNTNAAGSSGRVRMPAAGKVIAAFLTSDAGRTGGSCTLQVGIGGSGSAFASGGCALDANNLRTASALDATGLSFSSGDNLSPVLVTTGAWSPTTADATAWLVVRLES